MKDISIFIQRRIVFEKKLAIKKLLVFFWHRGFRVR